MSRNWRHPIGMAVLCLGLTLGALAAEDVAPAAPLTLQDCITKALQQQSDVLISSQTLISTKAKLVQAKSDYLPTVSVDGSLPLNSNGGRSNGGSSLTAAYTIYDSGQRDIKRLQAELGVKRDEAAHQRTLQTVIYNVTRSYLSLLRATKQAEVVDVRLKYTELSRDSVKTRIAAGDAAGVDLMPLEAQLANVRVDQLAAKNAVRTAAVQLQRDMGLTPGLEFPVQEVGDVPDADADTLDGVVAQALAQRPEILQSNIAVDIAKEAVKSAKINIGPRFTVTGSASLPVLGDRSSSWDINGNVALTLFDGDKNKATLEDARATLASAEERLANQKRQIVSDVQDAYLNRMSARERLTASALSLEAAEKNMAAQTARYKQGLATPLDLLNAQLDVATARTNAVAARYDYFQAAAQLDYAIGK